MRRAKAHGPARARRATSSRSRGVEAVRFATTRIRMGAEDAIGCLVSRRYRCASPTSMGPTHRAGGFGAPPNQQHMPRGRGRDAYRRCVAASQPRDHGAIVAGDEGDVGGRREPRGDVVQGEPELPRQAVGHATRLDHRVQPRDRSHAPGLVGGPPQRRDLVGPSLRGARLVPEIDRAGDGERGADGDQGRRQRSAGARARGQSGDGDQADPGEHAGDGGGNDEVAGDRRVAHRRAGDGRQRPGRGDQSEGRHGAIAPAPAPDQSAQRPDPHGCGLDAGRAAQELQRRIPRALQAARLGADPGQVEGVQQIPGAQPVGHDPEGEHARDAERERPPAPLAQQEVGGVGDDQQPHLGTGQPRQRDEQECAPAAGAQVQLDRTEHEGHHQRLDVARRQIAQPVRAGEERQRSEHPGDRAARPCREPEGQRQGRQAGDSHDHEPEARCRGAGERQRRGEEHRQGLPAGVGDGAEAGARRGELLAEDQPGPGIEGRGGGQRQRGHREGHASTAQRRAAEGPIGGQRASGADRGRHCRPGCTPSAARARRRDGQAHGAEAEDLHGLAGGAGGDVVGLGGAGAGAGRRARGARGSPGWRAADRGRR